MENLTWYHTHIPSIIHLQDFDTDCYAQRRLSGGSQSYGGESPRLSPYNSMGKLSKSDEQLSSLDCDSGQCSRNTSCETLGRKGAIREGGGGSYGWWGKHVPESEKQRG